MACVDSPVSPTCSFYDDLAPLQRVTHMASTYQLSPQEAQFIKFDSQRPSPRTSPKQHRLHVRASIVQKCSQLANRHRSTSPTTSPQSSPVSPVTPLTSSEHIVQWTQRLPSNASEFEEFLEWALDEAVGELVRGPNRAAEELEAWFNYGQFETAAPMKWVRVQAQVVEGQGRQWITASVQDSVAPGRRAAVYATGKWALIERCSRRHH